VITHEEHLISAKRELTMRQIRQILRLARDGISAREIGRMLGVARSTIHDNPKRAAAAGSSGRRRRILPTMCWKSGCSPEPA
jgi:IS30 family transposase